MWEGKPFFTCSLAICVILSKVSVQGFLSLNTLDKIPFLKPEHLPHKTCQSRCTNVWNPLCLSLCGFSNWVMSANWTMIFWFSSLYRRGRGLWFPKMSLLCVPPIIVILGPCDLVLINGRRGIDFSTYFPLIPSSFLLGAAETSKLHVCRKSHRVF